MKRELRLQARQLRADGLSVRKIAEVMNLPTSTISLWVRDVALTSTQVETLKLQNRRYGAQNKGAQSNRLAGQALRKSYQQVGRAKAQEGNPLHLAGCMLYWAEGAKARNNLQFANSDSNMMKLFIRFLREQMGVPDTKMRMFIHCHTEEKDAQHQIEEYWLTLLRLPRSQLRKTFYKRGSTTVHRNLPYGICRLAVYQSAILQHIYGAIQEYGGFEEPSWLD